MKPTELNVTLLAYTPEPEKTIATAARLCYAPVGAKKIKDEFSDEEAARLLRIILKSGHLSAVEHAVLTFAVEGVSRACTHQLVRHRLASYNQQSQRYVKLLDEQEFVIPPRIAKSAYREEFLQMVEECWRFYERMLDDGLEAEDARYILPNAGETKIIITMNCRELLHFFRLRCCRRAQWEIRNMAYHMLLEAQKVAPLLFEKAGPPCLSGPCLEGKFTCGKPLKRLNELEKDEDISI